MDALLQESRGGRHREYMTYEEEKAFLKRHIEAAQAGEFVTVNQLFEAYQKEIGRTSTRDGFYYLLKRHGWRTVTPRSEHPKKADVQTIETSKNKIYIDEAGFGRISKMSFCWAPQGIRPSIPSHYMLEYLYCYGAVDAQTVDSFFLIVGGCNTEWTNEFLRQVSQAYPDDYMLLVMDNAIWHKSTTLEIPSNVELAFIPPYTPEMNPIEQVWKEIRKRGFKNKAFQTLEAVIDKLQEVIQGLEKSVLKSTVSRQWTRLLFENI